MIRMVLVILLLSALPARAEFSLTDMVGNWTGTGVYKENLSQARLRCQVTVTGSATKVSLSGRCASSLGAQRVVLDFARHADGQVVVTAGPGAPRDDSPIEALTGGTSDTRLTVMGEEGQESVILQFTRNPDGTMAFVSERKWLTGKSQSSVILTRR